MRTGWIAVTDSKIIYTHTDEAPLLATYSFLPIIQAYAATAGVTVDTRDISLAGRIIAQFPDRLKPEQRIGDDLIRLQLKSGRIFFGQRSEQKEYVLHKILQRELPEIAIEVIVSHGSVDKLEVYRGLGIREIWLFEGGAHTVLSLRDAGYVKIPSSEVFPEVDLARIVQCAMRADQHAALREFRDELRGR